MSEYITNMYFIEKEEEKELEEHFTSFPCFLFSTENIDYIPDNILLIIPLLSEKSFSESLEGLFYGFTRMRSSYSDFSIKVPHITKKEHYITIDNLCKEVFRTIYRVVPNSFMRKRYGKIINFKTARNIKMCYFCTNYSRHLLLECKVSRSIYEINVDCKKHKNLTFFKKEVKTI